MTEEQRPTGWDITEGVPMLERQLGRGIAQWSSRDPYAWYAHESGPSAFEIRHCEQLRGYHEHPYYDSFVDLQPNSAGLIKVLLGMRESGMINSSVEQILKPFWDFVANIDS